MSDIQPEYNWKSPVDTYRWLKAQMDKEGYKGPVAGYQPKGYHKVFTGQSADPNVTYWKPYEISRTNALAPMAVYRHDTEKQTYWEDPANIGQWRDYLMLQEDDFVAPPYIDYDFIENSYQLMKQQNGGSDDWTSWKPLPFGHNLSYVAQQLPSPDTALDPNFMTYAENKYVPGTNVLNPAYSVQVFNDYANIVGELEAIESGKKTEFSKELQDYMTWVNQNATQQQIATAGLTEAEQANPIISDYQKEMEEVANADYNLLEPWEKAMLTFSSTADMKNRPSWSTSAGIVSRGLLESLGGMGTGALVGGLIGTAIMPGPGTVAGAQIGSLIFGAASGISSIDASISERKGEEVKPVTRIVNRVANALAELVERTMGTDQILGENWISGSDDPQIGVEQLPYSQQIINEVKYGPNKRYGGPEAREAANTNITWDGFWTAWKAAQLQYESVAGTENGGIGDWLIDSVSWLANRFERDEEGGYPGILNEQGLPAEVTPLNQINHNKKNSGLQTGLGEVWQLHKGLSGPRALKGSGTIGRDSQIELYNLLADKDNPLEPETVLAIYRDKYGFSGNINDMVYQTLLDPAVVMPRIMANVGLDLTTGKVQSIKDAISLEGASPALLSKLDDAIRWQNVMSNALGNPIVDMSPYPVQMLFDLTSNARGGVGPRSTTPFWQSIAEFRTLKQSGLLDVATGSFTFKQGDVDLGTVSYNKDNSFTWRKPDGTVEHMYSDVANAMGYKFVMEDGTPVLYVHGQRASSYHGEGEGVYTPPEGTVVVDADPNATQPPVAKATFEERVVTVTPDVELPDGTRATDVRVDPVAQTFEVHAQDGITYIARASDGIVIDTLNAEGVSIHDPNRTIKVNPVDIRVNGMTPKDIATAVDTVAIIGKPYVEPVQPDPRLAPRPVFPKDASLTTKAKWLFNEMRGLTRETQVRLSLRNYQDVMRNVLYLAGEGGSFTDVIKIVNGIFNGDIEKLSTAAQKLGNNIGIVTSKALFKEAINDPGVVAMVRLWQDPSNLQRVAAIKKLSGAIDVTPEVFVTMKPAELVSLIQKAVLKSGDKNALAMLGTITEASITSMIKPYSGKDPLPVTDKAMTNKWLNAVEVKIEEIAVKVYNVTPNSNIQRMLNLDKQFLSVMVMWAGYLRTNLLSNIGTGVGTAGVPVYRSKKMIDGFWDTLGMAKPSEGDTAFRVKTHGALFETLNGGNTIFKKALKKASVKLSDISRGQPFLKASGWLEGKAHEGADTAFTMQQMRRLQLPEPPPSVKAALIRELGQDGYQNWLDARNQAMNPEMMDDVYKVTDNTEVKLAEIQKAVVDSLYKDHPELGTELINTLGIEDSLRNIIKNAKSPEDVDAKIRQLKREAKEQPAIKAKIEAEAKLAEGAEKVRQEGILGLADVSMQIAESRLHTMLQSNAYAQTYWRKAMEAGPTGYHGAIRAGLENVKQLWDRANTNNLNLLKGALSAMDAADPRQQGLFVAANNWFTVGTEWADWRNNYWDTFHNAVHTEAEFVAAQEVVNLKSEEFRAREVEAIKAYAEEISNVLTNSQGKTVAGTDINQTGASAVALMEFFINGDKNVKGYLTIAKETEDFYSSTVGMPYKKRKELENKHFKKVAINLDKLQGEITKRAYNIWHRNNPAVAPAATSQQKPRAKHSDLDAKIANNNVQVKAAKAEIDAQTISKGNVTRSALRDFLSMTDTDPDIAMALVDSVAGAWAFNNGKRPEEWYQNIGELAFVDADTFSARVFDKVIETAGMTTFDNAGKAVLTFAKTGNLTTLTHELGHVIESTLNPDQLGLVVETFGDGLTVGEYGDLSNRFKANMPLSPEELAKHNKVAEGFAEGYQKWLMDDAVRMDTPSKLAQIFKTISDWLHKLIGRLSERISSMDFPDALKDLYERVTRVVDTASIEKTNSNAIAAAPTGLNHSLIDANNVTYPVTAKVMDLRNIINSHNTDGTVNTIFPPEFQPRTYNQLFVVDTAKKLNPIKLLEKNSGFATGPIIVNSSGVVLVGNHRSGAMRLAQMDYPDVWKAYETELVTRLADYGLSEKDIEGIEQPVIVYTVSDADARDVVKAGNIGEQQDYTAFDNAKRWSASFDIDTLTNMVIGENQSFDDAIRSDANKYIRGDFFNGLSAPEKTGFIDSKTGYLNDQGVSAIKRSLAYLAFGGNETGDAFLKTAFDNADGMSMNVLNAMLASVPYVVKLNAEIAKGNLPANYSISEMLVNGVKEYNSFMSLPPDARHLDQMNMFDQPVSGKLDRDMIKFFINYNQSPSVISGIIEKYVSSAIASIVPPEAVSMFDAPAVEPTQLFKDIIKKFTGQEVAALQAVTGNKSKALIDTMSANSAASWDAVVKKPITKSLREMLTQITPTPSTMPDWINVAGLMSEDVKKAYRTARATIKSILDEIEKPDTFKPSETRTIILQQAFTAAITVDQPLRNHAGLSGNKDVINWQANKLFQDIEQMNGKLNPQKIEPLTYDQLKEQYNKYLKLYNELLAKENEPGFNWHGEDFALKATLDYGETYKNILDAKESYVGDLSVEELQDIRQNMITVDQYYTLFKMDYRSSATGYDRQLAQHIIDTNITYEEMGELNTLGYYNQDVIGMSHDDIVNVITNKIENQTAEKIVKQAKDLLAQGASEETIDKILDAANEVIPLMDEQAAFEQVGGDPKREVGIEKALMVIDQPVRGTPMGKTTPPIRPDGEMMTELELEINTLLEAFGDEVKPRIGKDFEYPEGAREALNKQLPIDKESLKEKVMAAAQTGQALRHEMLVDYATRYGVDQLAEVVFPYQLWYTRSALLWLKKLATTPGLAAFIARYEEMLERNSLSGFPSRVGGKHMIPYGDNGALFFDWLGLVYPPKQIFGVIDNLADLSNTLYDETVSIITAQVRDGTLSAEAAKEAIAGRENETWNAAAAQAAAAWNEENNNAITMTSLAMLPRASFTNAYYYLINQEEKINPLTMTKLGNMLADVDPDGLIGVLGKIISLPENTVRKVGGLNRDGQWGEYYVDKKLAEMAMTGMYSPDEVIRAMIDRSGPAYDEATRLAAADLIATSQPGGIVWHAIQTKNLDGLMPAIMTALFPKGLYSEAEMEQRGLQKEYNAAWNDFSQGDPKALDNFFEAHPEYEARLAVFKEPEERLKEYMIGGIWDAYGKLSSADKSLVTDQLGTNFEVLFLDNKTRNYDQLTIDTLVVWGKQLGAGVPASAEPTQQVTPLETYKPDVSAAAQEFVDYRTANFPNWYTLQKAYYEASDQMDKTEMIDNIWDIYNDMSYNEKAAMAQQLGAGFQTYFLDKETRDYKKIEPMVLANWGQKLGLELPVQAQMLQDFPELRNYLDWKEQYLAANPVVKQWLDEKADAYDGSDLTEYGNTTKEWFAQFDPVVGSALILYAYGEPLQPAAKSELIKVWEALGKPNYTFEKWLQYGIGR